MVDLFQAMSSFGNCWISKLFAFFFSYVGRTLMQLPISAALKLPCITGSCTLLGERFVYVVDT